LIELRLQGDHLTGLLNGVAVIQAQDQRIAGSGNWGIDAADGWFESVEVHALGVAGAAAEAGEQWTDGLAEWWASPEAKRGLLAKESQWLPDRGQHFRHLCRKGA
jgi:hypothetical protein